MKFFINKLIFNYVKYFYYAFLIFKNFINLLILMNFLILCNNM